MVVLPQGVEKATRHEGAVCGCVECAQQASFGRCQGLQPLWVAEEAVGCLLVEVVGCLLV